MYIFNSKQSCRNSVPQIYYTIFTKAVKTVLWVIKNVTAIDNPHLNLPAYRGALSKHISGSKPMSLVATNINHKLHFSCTIASVIQTKYCSFNPRYPSIHAGKPNCKNSVYSKEKIAKVNSFYLRL